MQLPLVSRRGAILGTAAAGVAALAPRVAFAVPRTLRIGLVAPLTGPLAFFGDNVPFTLDHIQKATGGTIAINGTAHPFEILVRDNQSNPNRSAEVAQDLILREKIDIMAAHLTPVTVNFVADQCEAAGVPCVSNDTPLESYFFGRNGDPAKGFDWTFHHFFTLRDMAAAFIACWDEIPTNKTVGVLWPNDNDGAANAQTWPSLLAKAGYTYIDRGRFDMPAGSYNAQIAAFKAAGADIVLSIIPPPEFTNFWNECAQQDFRPKAVGAPKAAEFTLAVGALGERADGITADLWWSPAHPFASGLTGQSSRELAAAYEAATGRQWTMTLGFRHSLFELVFDVLKRTQDLDSPDSIRDAIRATHYNSIVGPIDFRTGPFPNTSQTPVVIGQWGKGAAHPLDITIVGPQTALGLTAQVKPRLLSY